MAIKKDVAGFIAVIFLLLGALFGMNIMTFIFGSLSSANSGFTVGSTAYNTSVEVQENSLEAIKTYSTGANTQMSVVSVVIVLALLLGLFGLFWKYFKDSKGNEKVGNFA